MFLGWEISSRLCMAPNSWHTIQILSKHLNKMWALVIYTALLFYLLTPGVLLALPPGASFQTQALVHAVVFALVYKFTHKFVVRAAY